MENLALKFLFIYKIITQMKLNYLLKYEDGIVKQQKILI
jgi:hypothetical protein